MSSEKFPLLITSAVVIAGNIVKSGTLIELDKRAAEDLLRRGRAELANDGNTAQDDDIDLSALTNSQLQEVASGLGLSLPSNAKKDELIKAIEAATA